MIVYFAWNTIFCGTEYIKRLKESFINIKYKSNCPHWMEDRSWLNWEWST